MTTYTEPLTRPAESVWRRVGGVAGVAGPIVFTAVFLVQGFVRSGEYDAVAEPVSALEAGPDGWVQQANFVGFGLCMVLFAAGVAVGLPHGRWRSVAAALFAVAATGLFLAALFPLREDEAGQTYDPGGHFVAGVTFFCSSALALLAASRATAGRPSWRGLSRYALVAGIVALAGFVMLGTLVIPDDGPMHDYAGLFQRGVIMLVTFPCIVAFGLRLLRRH
jgi:hypothetical protein